jgi:hypothetical protein
MCYTCIVLLIRIIHNTGHSLAYCRTLQRHTQHSTATRSHAAPTRLSSQKLEAVWIREHRRGAAGSEDRCYSAASVVEERAVLCSGGWVLDGVCQPVQAFVQPRPRDGRARLYLPGVLLVGVQLQSLRERGLRQLGQSISGA